MNTYLSLLRGINVTGYKKINMKELVALYESLKLEKVKTYIQSGNVVFLSDEKNARKLEKKIEAAIEEEYGFKVSVFVLTPAELRKVIEGQPFPTDEIKPLMISFLDREPESERIQALEVVDTDYEKYEIRGKAIYLYFPNGYGKAKLSNNFLESKLKVRATTRNWRTVSKLMEMVG